MLLLTEAELQTAHALGVLDGAEESTIAESTAWITEWGSVLDLAAEPERTFGQLVEGAPLGIPWLDTWEILTEIGLEAKADEWERQTAHVAPGAWARTLEVADCRWLRSVALRRLARLEDAEAEVLGWASADDATAEEVERQWSRLADALRSAGRPYEAHRLLARRVDGYVAPPDIPMSDLNPHLPLDEAVFGAVRNRLQTLAASTA